MKDQKVSKIKRLTGLTSMLFVILFGFSLLIADSQGEGVSLSFNNTPNEVHENFSLTGEVYYYDEDKERDVKEDEVSIDLKVYLLELETEESKTKEIYAKKNYPMTIDGRSFEMDFDIAELQIQSEYNKVGNPIFLELEFTIHETKGISYTQSISFTYSPKPE